MSRLEALNQISVKVAFSPACNLQCEYCGGSIDRKSSPIPAAMEDYRSENMLTGSISTDKLLLVLDQLYKAGFNSIRPTGGEPTLRSDWDYVVDQAAKIGYQGVDITTNGVTLNTYLDSHDGKLPVGLSTIKLSLDTCDPEEFRHVTGGADLNKIMSGVKRITDQVFVRANTVLLRRNLTPEKLANFMEFIHKNGLHQVQFLDLVYYPNLPNANKEFWEEEFVAFPEFRQVFAQVFPEVKFTRSSGQFGVNFFQTTLPDGLIVSFKDSTTTMRDKSCRECPLLCQEGRCLIRVGTDGNITFCPDYGAELLHFNGLQAIEDGTFDQQLAVLADIAKSSRSTRTIELFAKCYDLKLPVIV